MPHRRFDEVEKHPAWLRSLVLAAVYAVCVWVGRATHVPSTGFAMVWPAAGVGALWIWGSWPERRTRYTDVAAIGLVAAILNVSTGFNWASAGWYGLMNALQAFGVAYLLRRRYPDRLRLQTSSDLGQIAIACFIGCLGALGVFSAVVATSPGARWETGIVVVVAWLARNVAGAFLLISVFLILAKPTTPARLLRDVQRPELFLVVGSTVAVWWLALHVGDVPVAIVFQALLMWVALRFSAASTAVVTVGISVMLVAYAVHGRGPLGSMSPDAGGLWSQAVLLLAGGISLNLAVVRADRGHAVRSLAQAESRESELSDALDITSATLERAFDNAPLSMLIVNVEATPADAQTVSPLPSTRPWTPPQVGATRVTRCNSTAEKALGENGNVERRLGELIHRDDLAAVTDLLCAAAVDEDGNASTHRDITVYGVAGSQLMVQMRASLLAAEEDRSTFLIVMSDVTAQRRAERSLELHVLHDPLTGLANRVLFADRLDHALAASARSQLAVGVLYIDLDGFRAVNDSHGRGGGDELLAQVASRLSSVIRPGDTAARLSGDEFALVCPEISPQGLAAVANRLHDLLSRPYRLVERGARTAVVGVSIGAACTTGGGTRSGRELLRRADVAVVAAKEGGRGRVIIDSFENSSCAPGAGPR